MRMYKKSYGVEVEKLTKDNIEAIISLISKDSCPGIYGLEGDCSETCSSCWDWAERALRRCDMYKLTRDDGSFTFIGEDTLHEEFETRMV